MRAGVSKINPNPFTTRPELDGTFGVVASTRWITTSRVDKRRRAAANPSGMEGYAAGR